MSHSSPPARTDSWWDRSRSHARPARNGDIAQLKRPSVERVAVKAIGRHRPPGNRDRPERRVPVLRVTAADPRAVVVGARHRCSNAAAVDADLANINRPAVRVAGSDAGAIIDPPLMLI
jgi:hypothetical protein